jgi:hypothetical protein
VLRRGATAEIQRVISLKRSLLHRRGSSPRGSDGEADAKMQIYPVIPVGEDDTAATRTTPDHRPRGSWFYGNESGRVRPIVKASTAKSLYSHYLHEELAQTVRWSCC